MLLKLVPDNTNVRFLRWKYPATALSVLLIVASIVLVAVRGLNFGVDFTGGIMMEVGFEQAPDLDDMRRDLNRLDLGGVSLQEFGSERQVAIRLPQQEGGEQGQQIAVAKVKEALSAAYGDEVSFRRVETVGGKVSGELLTDAALAIGLAMVAVAFYIWFRFEWQFGVGALLSLIHDVAITFGFLALTQMEFNLAMVAAVLTTVGYSLNDTVVVYDRVRENLRKYRKMDMEPLLDLTINETLARTIMTSLSTSLALLALLLFGGEVIRGFTAAMLLGVAVGTFSSIYVAAPMLIWMKVGPHTFLQTDNGKAEKAEKTGKAAG